VFVAVRGMSLHNEIRVVYGTRAMAFNQDIKAVVANGLDPKFLFYALTAAKPQLLAFVESAGHGTGVLPTDKLSGLPIPNIGMTDQRAIAHILGTLDDKIELNRRTNETLEAMTRALFKDWFIDFGPVRAKMEGSARYLAGEVWSSFPSELCDSTVGQIPSSWEIQPLKELTSKIGSGATPRGGKEVYVDEGVSLIRSQNVYDSAFVWSGLARITDSAAEQLSGVEVRPEDVLLNITGASILRTCVVDPGVLPARVNQHVAIIRARTGIPPRYLHLHLLQKKTKDYLLGLNAGASREAVTKAHIESVPILMPDPSILEHFAKAVAVIYAKVDALLDESRSLVDLRDLLLPKLISGELRIQDAERFLAGVAS
jgi:type I restriction enzyme S subunit